MFTWLFAIKKWDLPTAVFATFVFFFTMLVVLTGVFCYARLDFVRSYDTHQAIHKN